MENEHIPELFGISIDNRPQEELEHFIGDSLMGTAFTRITTINPEFLVLARRDVAFARTLRAADVRVADGSGVVFAGLLSGFGISRYPGADLMEFILSEAERGDAMVFLATKKDGLSSCADVRAALLGTHPDLRVDGADMNPRSDTAPDSIRNAEVVLCNFGAPEQEYFLESLRQNPGFIRLAVGVGGAFDFVTGKRTRAPRWMRSFGLEWTFRLMLQPSRIGRIWTAVVVFPFLWLSDRMDDSRKSNVESRKSEG